MFPHIHIELAFMVIPGNTGGVTEEEGAMIIDLNAIVKPQVRQFYSLYLPHYQILKDFYTFLPEEYYDYRMVDTPERHSDTPRESLAHLLEHRVQIFEAVKGGKFRFSSINVRHYWQVATKAMLLDEWERIEQNLYHHLTDEHFESEKSVVMPWDEAWTVMETLYMIRDHDILHVGWNLALMDHFHMERFPSLRHYWG